MVAAAVLGLLVGVVVGGLGGGGGVLTLPALVYALGQSAQDATTGSVIIVAVTALTGVLVHRHGIDLRTGAAFGVVGAPAAWLGSLLNRHVAEPVLLLSFAGLALVAAAAMLRGDHPCGAERRAVAARTVACGLAVGFLTGFLGVGGGFLIVPALVVVLGLPMKTAAGTSLLVILVNAAAAIGSRAGALHVDWLVLAPFCLASIAGTVAGRHVADRLSSALLARAFAALLVVVGVFVGVQSLAAA